MVNQLKTTIALLFAAGTLSLVGTAPAQAGVCTGNGSATANFLLATILSDPGLTCTVGDKTYSNFSYTGFVSSDPAQNVVNMSESGVGGLQHTIGMMNTSGWTSINNTFNYTITKSSGPVVFDQWAAMAGSSIIGSNFNTTVTATNSSPSSINASGGFNTALSPSTFTDGTITSAFTNTFTVTSNAFTAFDNSLTQRIPTPSPAPGPLPILGAGAAFGFSRKLRSRIKDAA